MFNFDGQAKDWNITTDNESVHCLLIRGFQFLSRHNLVLAEISTVNGDVTTNNAPHPCDVFTALFPAFRG